MDTIAKIKQLAKEQKRSMAYLCEKMGVARVYFNDLQKANRDIPYDKLQIIAEALNTTVDYLLGNAEEPKSPQVFISYSSDNSTGRAELAARLASRQWTPTVDLNEENDGAMKKAKEKPAEASDDELKVALFGGDTEVTDEMWDEVMNYAEYIKQKYGKNQ